MHLLVYFFFNDTATTEIYTLSLHDALPIYAQQHALQPRIALPVVANDIALKAFFRVERHDFQWLLGSFIDRKSTRLNSSHANISYAVFCLKKKKQNNKRA